MQTPKLTTAKPEHMPDWWPPDRPPQPDDLARLRRENEALRKVAEAAKEWAEAYRASWIAAYTPEGMAALERRNEAERVLFAALAALEVHDE